MSEAQFDIGRVRRLKAEAIGVPGKRIFRLLVDAAWGGACLWIEKEQLFSLAVSIQRMLDATPAERGTTSSPTGEVIEAEYEALEFKIGRLSMGYDEEGDQFVFVVHDIDDLAGILEEADEAARESEEAAQEGDEEADERDEEDLEQEDSLEEALSDVAPTLTFRVGRQALASMCKQAQEVCMAGRPICPLCHQAINPEGHFCPRTNGHHVRGRPSGAAPE